MLIALILCGPSSAQDATTPEQRLARFEQGLVDMTLVEGEPVARTPLAQRMAELNVPGVSIAVIRDGKIDWAKSYGVTKVGGAPVTNRTLFQAGSVSKPIAAMAVLKLVDAGHLELDTDVNQYLKDWKVADSEFTAQEKVTLRRLLSHTAGLTVHGFPGYREGAPRPTLVNILNGEPPANTPPIQVRTVPGSEWRYSGGGYVLTQLILNDMGHPSFARLMRESVFEPIGMSDSTFDQPLPAPLRDRAAMPHDIDGQPLKEGPDIFSELAAAGLWTTATDIARYAIEVRSSLSGQSNHVLSQKMTREMLENKNGGDWGLGPGVGGTIEEPAFMHAGGTHGYQSYFVAIGRSDGITVLTNSDSGWNLIEAIRRTIAHDYQWPAYSPKRRKAISIAREMVDQAAGYYLHDGRLIHLIQRDARLFLSGFGRAADEEIHRTPEGSYFVNTWPDLFSFEANEQGKITSLIQSIHNDRLMIRRIDDGAGKRFAAHEENRLRDRMPMLGSEQALRRLISEHRRGENNYELTGPVLSQGIRDAIAVVASMLGRAGEMTSIRHLNSRRDGVDTFDVQFEHDRMKWHIRQGYDGITYELWATAAD